MNSSKLPIPEPQKIENRQATRKAIYCKVLLKQQNGSIIETKACDISTGGMALIADVNLPTGQACALQFSIQTLGEPPHVLQLEAQVMHSILAKGGFRIGLRFTTPDAQTTAHIQRFVNS
jgi:c-di-GMP-binding flagellar brake protein YcgR